MKNMKYCNARHILYVFQCLNRYDKKILPFSIMNTILSAAIPFVMIYLPKLFLDLVTQNESTKGIILKIGITGLFLLMFNFLNEYAVREVSWRKGNVNQGVSRDLFYKNLESDYQIYDDPDTQRQYARLRKSEELDSSYNKLLGSLSLMTAGLIGLFLYSMILYRLHIGILLLLFGQSFISYFFYQKAKEYDYKKRKERAHLDKKIHYVLKTSYNKEFGKDVRLYRMDQLFADYAVQLFAQKRICDTRIKRKYFFADVIHSVGVLARDGIVYVFLIAQLGLGRISPGDFTLFLGAVMGISGFLTSLIENGNLCSKALMYVKEIRDFMDSAPIRKSSGGYIRDKMRKISSITFEHVSFSYDKKKDVIHDFNLQINEGEKIALVGFNGAGKTTLIKLLCGLYQPDAGEIRIDGRDIQTYEKEELFSFFSPVFQDYFLPPFTFGQNISCAKEYEKERLTDAVDKAGLKDYVKGLSKGADTPMTRVVDPDGALMSGGELQKLLLARALYKDAPVLLLDEPTAALDPIAESKVYKDYNMLAENKISIFISHRLSSTKFCDRAIHLKDGRVIEEGTHKELLAAGGEYAKMFELQSKYYREGESLC